MSEPRTTWGLIRYFLYLGSLGFGGPVALIGYMQRGLKDKPLRGLSATVFRPRPPRDCSIRERGTQAWTTAESRNPSTSAHQTSHAIWNAFQSPCPIWSRTSISPTITSG